MVELLLTPHLFVVVVEESMGIGYFILLVF